MSAIPTKVRKIVSSRDGGACVRCGAIGALELHHRRYRSRGGMHDAANLITVCGWGNHTGCHGWAHTDLRALGQGYSLRSGPVPAAQIPCWFPLERAWFLLNSDGSRDELIEADAMELMILAGVS